MQEAIDKLRQLDFSEYEAKVLTVLFNGNNMTAAEIADEAGIPRPSVYNILKSFAAKGYCNEIQTTTKLRYEMIDPEIIKTKILRNINNEQKKKTQSLNESMKLLEPLYKSQEKKQYNQVELIKGYNTYRHIKFIELIKKAEKEILIMNRLEGDVSTEIDTVVLDFFRKGGKIKSIYQAGTDFKLHVNDKLEKVTEESLIQLYEGFEKAGEEIRIMDTVPQNISIFDRKIVYFNLFDKDIPSYERTDTIIYNEGYADFMAASFFNFWNQGITVSEFKQKLKTNQ